MKKEQEFLVQKAQDSLRAAKILAGENLPDFAASRAYYAMFYIAEAFLVGENISFSKHSAVISKFGELFARTSKIDPKFHHEIDHIIAEKHGGKTSADNLALTCWRCNRYKGSDLGSFNPETRNFSFLFNPRNQEWKSHLMFSEVVIVGLTPEGRTTVKLLQMNTEERLAERQKLRL